ncbi:hypothetical protein [Yinghuangia seranimata]|uniref:hypothetical protein n=1 Tax=Yinghuangia seranimata TaxID=408067 RepID=UPI00248ABB56|nr:hypothetical protein [Yinghuangia seranimata]MDI2128749.1 hypothetical protein [Yinghuangia seranimata]
MSDADTAWWMDALHDAQRTLDLADGARTYIHTPGVDFDFAHVVLDGLTQPHDANGLPDWDQYPPAGHGFPAVS